MLSAQTFQTEWSRSSKIKNLPSCHLHKKIPGTDGCRIQETGVFLDNSGGDIVFRLTSSIEKAQSPNKTARQITGLPLEMLKKLQRRHLNC